MRPEWVKWKERSMLILIAIPFLLFGALLIGSELENPSGYMPKTAARFVLGTVLGVGGISVFFFGLFSWWRYKKAYRDALPRP